MKELSMIKALYTLLALSLTSPAFSQAPGPQVQVELKIIEIDEKDYDELMAELKAAKGATEFWEKVQKFPGADLLSAPRITALVNQEAGIELGQDEVFPVKFNAIGEWTKSRIFFVGIKVQITPTLKKNELMAELKAAKGAPEFWEKVQKFPGADLLSAPSIELRLDAEFSKLVEVNVPNVPNATIPVFNSRKIQSNLILTDGVPAVMGGLSSDGRRTLIICTAKLMKDTVGD